MRKSQKIDRQNAAVKIDLGNSSQVYHFHYNVATAEQAMDLEDILAHASEYLRNHSWDHVQNTKLVVIGVRNGKRYILNQPDQETVDKLISEYGAREAPKLQRVNNRQLSEVIVRNMVDSGPTSLVLKGPVTKPYTKNGFVTILPTQFDANTKELGELIDELMQLRMLRINSRVSLQWLRSVYRHFND